MHLTQQVQTCIVKGCDGFYVPDITGRTMCYKCGPRDMLPAFMPPIRNYGDSSFDFSKSVKGTEFKDLPQSIIDEVDKASKPYVKYDYSKHYDRIHHPIEGLNPVMAGTPDKVAYSSMPVAPPKTSSPPRVEGLKGSKHDIGKAPWHLLPWEEVEEVVKVLQHGAAKYGEFNWMQVPDARKRYFSAAMRHLAAYANGQGRDLMDKESGLSHMSHAVCSILFIMHFERGRI